VSEGARTGLFWIEQILVAANPFVLRKSLAAG